MCTYRNVGRSLLTTATAVAILHGGGAGAAAQAAVPGRMNPAFISIVVTEDAVVWTHQEGANATLYSARAPDYRPSRLSSMPVPDAETTGGAAGMLSPDGSWILYLRDGLLYRLPAADGAVGEGASGAPLFETIGVITHAAWSPDGSRIAFVMVAPKARSLPEDRSAEVPSFVGVFDLATGRRWFLSPAIARDASPVWSPDGCEIFFQRSDREELGLHPSSGTRAVSANDARMVDRGTSSSSLMVGDVESGEVRTLWSDVGDAVVLIGSGGSSLQAVAPGGHHVSPPLARRASR